MTARLSLYQKAEQELYKLDNSVKATFYNFCHRFREDPDHPGLDLKPLKGDSQVFRAKINQSYRALLAKAGVDADGKEHWLIVAVRHRKDVDEELSVAVNRVTGELEFVDLAVAGDSVLQRTGITLTSAEPETHPTGGEATAASGVVARPATPLLADVEAEDLRSLGVNERLIKLALAVADSAELDQLLIGAPPLSKDVLYGLAAGMGLDEVRHEITAPVEVELGADYADDLTAALARTAVTTVDEDIKAVLEEGSFRQWKVYLHPTQGKLVKRRYSGPARVSGGPGTGNDVRTERACPTESDLDQRLAAVEQGTIAETAMGCTSEHLLIGGAEQLASLTRGIRIVDETGNEYERRADKCGFHGIDRPQLEVATRPHLGKECGEMVLPLRLGRNVVAHPIAERAIGTGCIRSRHVHRVEREARVRLDCGTVGMRYSGSRRVE